MQFKRETIWVALILIVPLLSNSVALGGNESSVGWVFRKTLDSRALSVFEKAMEGRVGGADYDPIAYASKEEKTSVKYTFLCITTQHHGRQFYSAVYIRSDASGARIVGVEDVDIFEDDSKS
ncbi:MAG: hypothetical protein Q4D38_08935 [Planctomycetia bacterium]|nr:hypothetical protein [Planctomycetia bacterium]